MSATEILEQIRKLRPEERREVVEQIEREFMEYHDDLSAEQIAELERRAAEARAHPERGIPWETIRAELYSRYKVKQ
jgi:putative addiction module component (TIGR02574 family)